MKIKFTVFQLLLGLIFFSSFLGGDGDGEGIISERNQKTMLSGLVSWLVIHMTLCICLSCVKYNNNLTVIVSTDM